MMKLIEKICNPATRLGRVNPEWYGLLWSLAWLMAVALACLFIPLPWGALSGLAIEALAFFVTLRVTPNVGAKAPT
jgi:membrane protein YdbS with pleckstrin-like domain